jgi:hypothetical protein
MTLEPMKYFRFRDIAIGQTVATNEVAQPSAAWTTTIAAGHVGAAALPPALAVGGAKCVKFGTSNLRLQMGNEHTYHPDIKYMTMNYWYRNPTSPGAVNQRIVSIPCAEWSSGSLRPVHCFFNWNNVDNGLVESIFRNPTVALGAAYWANEGNSASYRYLAYPASVAVNNVTMVTYRFNMKDSTMAVFKNGVKQNEFTWPYGRYRPLRGGDISYSGQWILGSGYNGSSYFDYSTAEMSEFSLHNRPLTDEEIFELYSLGTVGHFSRTFVGTVTDGLGAGISRMVRAHKHTNGDLLWETTSDGAGDFSVYSPSSYKGEIYVLAFDDLNLAPDYNAAIQARVVPTS